MKFGKEQQRFSVSFAASVAAHLLLALLIVTVQVDKPLPKKQPPEFMDVVLLDPETSSRHTPPEDTKTISNRSAEGGSTQAEDRVTRTARSPQIGEQQNPKKPTPPAQPKTPPPPSQRPEQRTRTLARRDFEVDRDTAPEKPKPPTPVQKQPPAPQVPLASLMPSTMALAQLSRDFERERRMKQLLSREADIPINTKEAKYAPYAQSLVTALEEQWRPGQADYNEFAEDARRVLIRITIENNGELSGIEILRPSPITSLNESAVTAIHAAAPFKPLPSSWGLDRASFYLSFEVVEDKFVFRTL